MSQNNEQRLEREAMQKQMEMLMEELRDAKQSWAVGDENPKREQ